MLYRVFITIIFFLTSIVKLYGQDLKTYENELIVITAARSPIALSTTGRSIRIINKAEIAASSAQSVAELINSVSGVDVIKRGPFGIQSEARIRGGSFEQTLILVNGIKVNDPQTGHHNMNIPVNLADINRIEVMKGHGSGIYGAGAFSGVINIITGSSGQNNLRFTSSAGENGFFKNSLSMHGSGLSGRHRLSFSGAQSDGYIPSSDFRTVNLFYCSDFSFKRRKVKTFYGYNDKKFGASTFYSDAFPQQWEHTTTHLAGISADIASGRTVLMPKLYFRRHDDLYLLDRDRPFWYRNEHTTYVSGGELTLSRHTASAGTFSLTAGIRSEQIKSNNLGSHRRFYGNINAENSRTIGRLSVLSKLHSQYYDRWGWKVWPAIDLHYRVNETFAVRSSAGLSYRMPTFTELYYQSPSNNGNKDLRYEKAISYETGITALFERMQCDISLFRRNGKNLIDWVRASEELPWQAVNATRLNTTGLEAECSFYFQHGSIFRNIRLQYAFITSDKKAGAFQSKYVMNYLRHHVSASLNYHLPALIEGNITVNWKNRHTGRKRNYIITDITLKKSYSSYSASVTAANVFDTHYYEATGVPMPGRWISAGISISFGKENR